MPTGEGWVAAGPETDVGAFVGGIDHIGALPPSQPGPDYSVYMQQRRSFLEGISLVSESTLARESDAQGGGLNLVGSASMTSNQIRP